MKLKENTTQRKLRGGYYTPQKLADYITKITLKDKKKILEPSCGDGSFLKSIKNILDNNDYNIEKIDAIEYIEEEANKSKRILKNINNANVTNDDFYNFYVNCKDKYNLIIGNPPYIRYQYLTEFQREKQAQVLIKNKMKSNKLINSWVFFLVACIELLEKNGTIAFVIPAEIMQVAYAEDLRKYLSKHLSKINIISFNKLLFEDAEQEVVVLIGTKKDKETECLISNCIYDDIDDFIRKYNENDLVYEKILTNDKWTRYYLKEKENNVIEEIKKDSRFRKIGDVGLVNVGITTGNNNYFSLDDDYVKKYDLKKYTKPLIGRSSQTHGLIFDEKDWKRNVDKGVKAYLLTINEDVDVKNMSKGQRKYIKIGEDNGENKGYKCRIRKRWYSVPSIWIPDAFLLRRSNVYPKFVLNGIDAVSTDTMHRIKIKDEYDNRNSSYMEFLHQKNSLSILKKVYKELEKAELYREYSRQILSYHEYFRGNEKLASGSYNDKTEDGYLTNLTVLQMPEKMISEKKIEQHIEKGRCFTLKEYQRPLNQEIPLIAGYDYQKVFHLNQKIKAGYLGTENCTFKIVGFLHKNTRLSSELNLDETLIMPTVSKMKTMKQENEKILMSVKCSGYFCYKNEKEYRQISNLLKRIRRETGYRYVIPQMKWKSNNLLPMTTEKALIFMSLNLLLEFIVVYKVLAVNTRKVKTLVYKTVALCTSGSIFANVFLRFLFPKHIKIIQIYFSDFVAYMIIVFLLCAGMIGLKEKRT